MTNPEKLFQTVETHKYPKIRGALALLSLLGISAVSGSENGNPNNTPPAAYIEQEPSSLENSPMTSLDMPTRLVVKELKRVEKIVDQAMEGTLEDSDHYHSALDALFDSKAPQGTKEWLKNKAAGYNTEMLNPDKLLKLAFCATMTNKPEEQIDNAKAMKELGITGAHTSKCNAADTDATYKDTGKKRYDPPEEQLQRLARDYIPNGLEGIIYDPRLWADDESVRKIAAAYWEPYASYVYIDIGDEPGINDLATVKDRIEKIRKHVPEVKMTVTIFPKFAFANEEERAEYYSFFEGLLNHGVVVFLNEYKIEELSYYKDHFGKLAEAGLGYTLSTNDHGDYKPIEDLPAFISKYPWLGEKNIMFFALNYPEVVKNAHNVHGASSFFKDDRKDVFDNKGIKTDQGRYLEKYIKKINNENLPNNLADNNYREISLQ